MLTPAARHDLALVLLTVAFCAGTGVLCAVVAASLRARTRRRRPVAPPAPVVRRPVVAPRRVIPVHTITTLPQRPLRRDLDDTAVLHIVRPVDPDMTMPQPRVGGHR